MKAFAWVKVKLFSLKETLLKLLKTGLTPSKMAMAFTVGFICGLFPVYGTQTVIAVSLGFVFGLNQVVLNIGSWVSVPVYFLLLYPMLRIGEFITGAPALDWARFSDSFVKMADSMAEFQRVITEYSLSILHIFAGFILVALVICIPMYYLALLIFKRMRIQEEPEVAA